MEKEERAVDFFAPDSLCSPFYQNQFKCHEYLYGETFHFERGKSYGILCEVSEGGGALSWILSGRVCVWEEEITVFGRRYSKDERVKEGWFLGEGIRGMNKPVAGLIRTALNRNRLGLSRSRRRFIRVKDVAEKFSLTKDGLRSRIEDCGWEGWRASAAIGYAMGRQIFCFPWLYTRMLMGVVANTGYFSYVEELKKAGGIVIVPASHRGILEEITDEIIEAPGLRQKVDMNLFYRYMDEYRNNKG